MKQLAALVFLVAAGAAVALAADVSGKWTAQTQGMSGMETTVFEFRLEGERVSGTVTTPDGNYAIKDGTITGNDLRFYITVAMGRDVKFTFTGTLAGEEITFTRDIEGMARRSTFVATRLK